MITRKIRLLESCILSFPVYISIEVFQAGVGHQRDYFGTRPEAFCYLYRGYDVCSGRCPGEEGFLTRYWVSFEGFIEVKKGLNRDRRLQRLFATRAAGKIIIVLLLQHYLMLYSE